MTTLANALACVLSLGCAIFLWKDRSLYRNGLVLAVALLLFCLFSFFSVGEFGMPTLNGELFPFRMMALTLCFSTVWLSRFRRRYLVMAQFFWLWIELFGSISLYYRGTDVTWTRIVALAGMTFCSTFLSRISREMEFCLMVFWIAIWIFL